MISTRQNSIFSSELVLHFSEFDRMTATRAGIWNGVIFTVSAIVGLVATRSNPQNISRRGIFTALFLLSVCCSLLATVMFILSIFAVVVVCTPEHEQTHTDTSFLGLRVTSLILYVILSILFIVTAALSCCQVCCCRRRPRPVALQLHGQQMVYIVTMQSPDHQSDGSPPVPVYQLPLPS